MLPNCLHLATRARRLTALAILATALTGCQSITGNQPYSQVRVTTPRPTLRTWISIRMRRLGSTTSASERSAPTSPSLPEPPSTRRTSRTRSSSSPRCAAPFPSGPTTPCWPATSPPTCNDVLRDQSRPRPRARSRCASLARPRALAPPTSTWCPRDHRPQGSRPSLPHRLRRQHRLYQCAQRYLLHRRLPCRSYPSAATPLFTGSQALYPRRLARTIVLIDQRPDLQSIDQPAQQPPAAPRSRSLPPTTSTPARVPPQPRKAHLRGTACDAPEGCRKEQPLRQAGTFKTSRNF